jgi:hypothetical protein
MFDEPVVLQCYTSEQAIERQAKLREFSNRTSRKAKPGAIGLVIDRDYLEIGFSLEDTLLPRYGKGPKRGEGKISRNIKRIADGLGAKVVGHVPDTGGGALRGAHPVRIVASAQARLVPGQEKRAGRLSNPSW